MWRIKLSRDYDVVVFGSGFGGSLIAMIAKRLGYSVLLLERGKHPRFTIGESSTPLANLLLDELISRYNLQSLKPLTKWGTWQQVYPGLPCGLKRGFTFYHHEMNRTSLTEQSKSNELLVAASPRDEIADTHWYRADFDMFFLNEAQQMGVDYLDQIVINNVKESAAYLYFEGIKEGETSSYHAKFAVDATGPRGLLYKNLNLGERMFPEYPQTQALYCHFSGVAAPAACKRHDEKAELPYPPEAAAVHHVFDGGWIWILRFNNGITSAGVAVSERANLDLSKGEQVWDELVNRVPALKEQFKNAHAEQPFIFVPRLSFMSELVCGDRWAMLPSSAGFVDPLLSTGFPLTLFGIDRLARILEDGLDFGGRSTKLQNYAVQTQSELLATAHLVRALYANMSNFAVFKAISLLYFAAASYSETARRLGKAELASSFLLSNDLSFGRACESLLDRSMSIEAGKDSESLIIDILKAIEIIDVAGFGKLNDPAWYPVVAEDLLNSAWKVGATRAEVESMLARSGFYSS